VVALFSRRVLGWALGNPLERTRVLAALDMAVTARKPVAGLLCHSGWGNP